MRRILCFLLALLLALPVAAGAVTFSPKDAYEARQQALALFRTCGMSGEYGDSRDFVIRWAEPIRIYVDGSPSRKDLQTIDDFLLELACRVPEMPPISRVDSEARANMVIHFCRTSRFGDYLTMYESNLIGCFTVYYNNSRINRAVVCIATDISQSDRVSTILEEITGALGLCNDHTLYTDSILHNDYNTAMKLSEVDWMMLNILYSSHVQPGYTYDQVADAINAFYNR